MNFAPKTEKQIAEEGLIAAGIYPFEVIEAESKRSKKSGNDMIELQLRIFMPDGSSRKMRDWLLEAMAHKLFHFCAFTGLSQAYQNGSLTSHDCVGKTGYVKITQKVNDRDELQNNVGDYVRQPDAAGSVLKSGASVLSRPKPTEAQMANLEPAGEDSSIPF